MFCNNNAQAASFRTLGSQGGRKEMGKGETKGEGEGEMGIRGILNFDGNTGSMVYGTISLYNISKLEP